MTSPTDVRSMQKSTDLAPSLPSDETRRLDPRPTQSLTKWLTRSDKVSVSVYVPQFTPVEGGRRQLRMKAAVDHLEVFPTHATETDTFTIRWSNINYHSLGRVC